MIRWKDYHDAKRWDKTVSLKDFTDYYELTFARLPGYERMSQAAYMKLMREKLRKRTALILNARQGKKAVGAEKLKGVKPGTRPQNTTQKYLKLFCRQAVGLSNS